MTPEERDKAMTRLKEIREDIVDAYFDYEQEPCETSLMHIRDLETEERKVLQEFPEVRYAED